MGTVMQEIAKQTLAAVPIEDGEFFRPLAAIYKKNKVLSPAMKQFLAILKERLTDVKLTGGVTSPPFLFQILPDSAASNPSAERGRPCG